MDTTASTSEAGYPSLNPSTRDTTTGYRSTPASLCQQTPIYGDVNPSETEFMLPQLSSSPALQFGAVQDFGHGPSYISPIVNPQTESRSSSGHGMQAVNGNFNPQGPSYKSLVPVQPFQPPLQQAPPSAYPTSYYYNQPPVHLPPQPPGVIFVQLPAVNNGGAVVQQPRPPPPIRTSFKFHIKEIHDNQLYFSVCLLVFVIVCINPLTLACAISGLYFAYKSARANQQNLYEEARKHHHTASTLNLCAFLTTICCGILAFPFFITFIIFMTATIT